ncbi:ComEC/Rec2 family competence protein [Kitasatospora sp. NE20-6]|uniref:ComEC/Rec2 family competence protein n=1 Tax=Kitasatospora sp. NE20-6 TaxID=2859066 RepID=UPI0038B23731
MTTIRTRTGGPVRPARPERRDHAPPDPGEARPDLRLLVPALTAWAVTSAVLGVAPRHHPLLVVAALLVTSTAVLLLRRPADRPADVRRLPARTLPLMAAVLLTAAAATLTTVLHTADLHRGPIPELARPLPPPSPAHGPPSPSPLSTQAPAVRLSVDLTLAGDPTARTGRVRGTVPGQTTVTFDAVVERVRFPGEPDRPAVTVHTPVQVVVRAPDIAQWRTLVPSTRVAADVTLPTTGTAARPGSAARLTVHGPPRQLSGPNRPQQAAARLRAGLRSAADHLPPDTRGLLPGLVVGDTSRLPDDLREAFRATDLGHLTSVSGANLAIVMAVLTGAPRRPGEAGRGGLAGLLGLRTRTTVLCGAVLTLAFVTVCRPEPSVLRAAATGLIGLLALATGRPRQGVPALSGAVLLLVLLDPQLSRSYGFLLSTLATAGLLTLAPRWADALRRRGWPGFLATAVAATAAAQACCAPVTILLAPRVSLVAVPCNLLAEAAVAPATLLGFAALAVAPTAPSAARLLVDLAALPTGWLAAVARHGAALPGALFGWPTGPTGAALLAGVTLALCWALPPLLAAGRTAPQRVRAALAVSVALVLAVVLLRPPALVRIATGWPPPGWRFAMCDVGQGDMTVLPVAPRTAVVVDAGPDPAAADACLRRLGVTRIPLLILSHFHADHVEGVPGVVHGRSVGALQVTLLGSPPGEQARVLRWASAARIPVLRADRGEHRTAGPELSWDVLWPDDTLGPATPGANNASIALIATVGPPGDTLRMALLGDLEPPAQAALLRAGPPPARVDVLKVAHHGSAHQDWDLAGALHPRLALVSCGRQNPYGHPAARTVDRLTALGATVLRTDRAGDIAVVGGPGRLGVATGRHP